MKRWMVLLALFATLLAACGTVASRATTNGTDSIGQPVAVPGGSYTNVSTTELQQMLASKDFALVNTHVPFEGDLPATDRSVPYNEIEQQLDQLPADKNAKIVLYCRTGRMSDIAARTLVQQGYTSVWNLDGGMVAWEQAGLPLER